MHSEVKTANFGGLFPRSEALRRSPLRSTLRRIAKLTAANLKVRYRKTLLGFLWVLMNPLLLFLTQCFIFRHVLKIQMNNYTLFLLSGLLPWIFISQTLEICTTTFVNCGRVLKSHAVHPLVFLAAQIGEGIVNFLLCFFTLLLPSLFLLDHRLGLLLLPLPIALLFFGIFGLAWLCATLHVYFRDTRFIVSFALSILFFLTPIFYPPSLLDDFRWLVVLNPFYHLIEPFRVALLEFTPLGFLLACARAVIVCFLANGAAFLCWKWKGKEVYFYI